MMMCKSAPKVHNMYNISGYPPAVRDLDPGEAKDRLMALLPPDGSPIGNATLYRKLRPQGWSKDDFARVRAALVAEGRIAKGKGRGGSIRRLGGPQLDLIAEAPVARDPMIEALAVDVAAMVRDRGRLTRQEILDFGIPEALYPAVQKAVLAAALDVEKVPNKNGGLVIVPTTSLGPLDGSITTHREVLQQRGYLARTESRTVQTQQRVTAAAFPTEQIAKVAAGASSEFLDRAIAQRVDRVARRMKIADEILAILRSEDPKASVLYFGPSVVDAQLMAMLLREQKLRAAFVSGETRMAVRRRLINEFRAGSLQVLCNCEVLTTGFDAPRVTHIVMGRPTVSIVLYEQIVGRGLRGAKFGGTETCVIVDCVDDYRGIQPIRLAHEDFRRIWESRAYELV